MHPVYIFVVWEINRVLIMSLSGTSESLWGAHTRENWKHDVIRWRVSQQRRVPVSTTSLATLTWVTTGKKMLLLSLPPLLLHLMLHLNVYFLFQILLEFLVLAFGVGAIGSFCVDAIFSSSRLVLWSCFFNYLFWLNHMVVSLYFWQCVTSLIFPPS